MKVNKLKQEDRDFPQPLRHIPNSPEQIYWEGADPATWLEMPRLAVVGSRKASPYGRQVTESIVDEIARAGVVIISGMALGIDATAHRAAIEAGGITVAVLPTPLDKIYPVSHTNLSKQIVASDGCLLSEYPPGSTPYKVNFTARNRIISGLSDGVLITEAALHSGTMATLRFALDQGKTVMAIPGNITSPNSEGVNNVIKSGGVVVTEANDVFDALNMPRLKLKAQASKFRGTDVECRVVETIKSGTGSQEDIAIKLKLGADQINAVLTNLEINGYIKPAGGGIWRIG